MRRYSIEPRTRKYVKGYGFFFNLLENLKKKHLLDTELDVSKKIVHKTGEYLGNKTAEQKLNQTRKILRNNNLLEK